MTNLVINVPGEYISLGLVMQSALEQASRGKGRERHASEGEAYSDQIICEVTRRLGSGYPLGQAVKKIYESQRIGGEKGVAELLGAINYIAAAVIVTKEELEDEDEEERRDHEFLEGVFAPYAEKKPEFKPGDKVQFRDEIPSTSEPHWFEGIYVERLSTGGHAVKFGPQGHVIHCSDKDIRRVPKAEGCEALVEHDAPQTKEDLFNRIVDCNPATFGRPRTPTGEELAEMAEEETHG